MANWRYQDSVASWRSQRQSCLRSRLLARNRAAYAGSARSRTRTGTESPPRDFKSLASTDFATRARAAGRDSTATRPPGGPPPRLPGGRDRARLAPVPTRVTDTAWQFRQKLARLTLRVDTSAYGAKPLNLRDSRAVVPPPAGAYVRAPPASRESAPVER